MRDILEQITRHIHMTPTEFQPYEDLYYMCKEALKDDTELAVQYLKQLSGELEETTPQLSDVKKMQAFFELHRKVLLAAAPFDFESYIL